MDLPEAVMEEVTRRGYGRHTDERIKRAAARLRGLAVPVRQVAEWLGISPNTVLEAERECPDQVVTLREKTARRWELVQLMCAEELTKRLQEDPTKIKFAELGLTGGIAATKAAEARGEATQIVEHRQAISVDDVLAKMRAAKAAIDVQSSVSGQVPEQIAGSQDDGCADGCISGDLGPDKGTNGDDSQPAPEIAQRGGGGVAVSTGGGVDDGLASENLNTNVSTDCDE